VAVHLRLTRTGRHKRPLYRVVAADSRKPRDGRFLEILGSYDPTNDPATIKLDPEKVKYWLDKGAVVSEAAGAILKKQGLLGSPASSN